MSKIPELLVSLSGQKIDSVELWERFRRREILYLFQEYVYGVRDIEKPEGLYFEVKHEEEFLGMRRKDIRCGFDKFQFSFSLFLPLKHEKPVPCFVQVMHDNMERGYNFNEEGSMVSPLYENNEIPVKEITNRGFGIAIMGTRDIYHDWLSHENYKQGIFTHVTNPKGRQPNSWATISAWAWGTSRIMDYLETEPEVDEKNVAVGGHSRSGKTALWAAATDTRFKLAFSNNSGCMGAAVLRGKDGEHAKDINISEWFCQNFKEYDDYEEMLPVDQHMLIALIAPRYVYVTSTVLDTWSDPNAEYLGCHLASPAFELYGVKGFVAPEGKPELLAPCHEGHIAYHMKEGDHSIDNYDWFRVMDYFETIL